MAATKSKISDISTMVEIEMQLLSGNVFMLKEFINNVIQRKKEKMRMLRDRNILFPNKLGEF